MKAIFTKYIGPTNFKGSRVKAYDGDNNAITIDWDDDATPDENHKRAAHFLCREMRWCGALVMGAHKNVNAHVFVERIFTDDKAARLYGYTHEELGISQK